MADSTLLEPRHTGESLYSLASRSASSVMALSSSAIVAMTVGGSVFIFLLITGPLLFYRAKRQDRDRAAEFPTSNLVEDGDIKGSRRLRKKSASEGVAYSVTTDADSIGGEMGAPTKHLSLPNLPSIFSSPGNWRISGPFTSNRPWDSETGDDTNGSGSENGARAGTGGYGHGEPMYESPEKHRGYVIYQNRRKTSWIDEDTLHGPRVSPKKNAKRKSSWFPGNELTRSLSRHLSFRRLGAPELARSPTLPCIETSQDQPLGGKGVISEQSLTSRKTRSTENEYTLREYGTQAEPRFPVRQPLQQGGSLNSFPKAQPLGAAIPSSQGHSNTVMNAAQQLAGRARVPSVDAATNGQRYSRFQQSNTDADLQAILRRTAERLQDGNPSTRRQTLMLPSSSSSSRWPDQPAKDSSQDCGCGKDHAQPCDTTPSPARSQKSAPAAVSYSELEGCSPKIQQSLSQNNAPWQTHRRTHTQVSPISTRSAPGNVAATPRSSTQLDGSHTFLPSPSRMSQISYSYSLPVLDPQSYSPASEKSSALSTVYSEDERTPPPSALKAESVHDGGTEMERRAMAQALRACDAFDGGQMGRDDDIGKYGASLEAQEELHLNHSHQPLHIQEEAFEHALPNTNQAATFSASTPAKSKSQAEEARISPKALSTSTQTIKAASEDPFTTYTTPKRHTPQRLSQVFSPLPAELPSNSAATKEKQWPSETPTPSPSHRRVVPPPYRLRPVTSSPTLGHHQDPQFQIQPPSREPSPALSESGLSSVYDSYRYSRCSDNFEGSQSLARFSTSTMLTVPTAETSPTETAWDDDIGHIPLVDSRKNYRGIESGAGASRLIHLTSNHALSGAGPYTHLIGNRKSSAVDLRVNVGYAVEGTLPHSQQSRQISLSDVSDASGESAYSQDEDEQDRLGPLMPFRPGSTAPGKHGMRVTSAVAELRRMNSQVSCVSGYSTATTNVAGDVSPTLPALRGGGCSPGKKGAGGGVKNYLSLGNSPPRGRGEGEGEGEGSHAESEKYNAVGGVSDYEQNEKTIVPPGLSDTVTIRRGGRRRSRRSTIVESFEEDLDRARKVLRESGGYNLQASRELPTKSATPRTPRGPRTHAAKLSQEEARSSPMGLGLYDNKGFLRSSVTSQDLTGHI
ncbi:hypothetical protein F5Y09DRAFT_344814 [Xylaria sp. FL1042]|nr:hypothetical protein F5Y09DRAFT_344814 [Xylaria sp. FL1042]